MFYKFRSVIIKDSKQAGKITNKISTIAYSEWLFFCFDGVYYFLYFFCHDNI
jgi:hypothetical protein